MSSEKTVSLEERFEHIEEIIEKMETGDFFKLVSAFVFNTDERKEVSFEDDDFRGYEKVFIEDTTKHLYTFWAV